MLQVDTFFSVVVVFFLNYNPYQSFCMKSTTKMMAQKNILYKHLHIFAFIKSVIVYKTTGEIYNAKFKTMVT